MAEPIEMLFGFGLGWAQGIVLDGAPAPPWEGIIFGERGTHFQFRDFLP